ncbi:hypothetical protein AKG94_21475 [Vibrio harveyi]|uniref:hypothetical protein n=1 Tax=Vibrio harveyi TaxID=669 RepID=UPI00069E8D95|nr:hypothetical protein [Vibrio harveyi]KNY40443.1 hypothetical protein AKG94_21475 [Vibrio harveyi]
MMYAAATFGAFGIIWVIIAVCVADTNAITCLPLTLTILTIMIPLMVVMYPVALLSRYYGDNEKANTTFIRWTTEYFVGIGELAGMAKDAQSKGWFK